MEDSSKSSSFYLGKSGEEYHFQKRGVPERIVPWLARCRAEKLARWISPNAEVIEIGVGAGWNLMKLNCKRRVGVDPSEFLAVELQKHRIEYSSSTTSLGEASCDVVLCHHVLEHVPNPLETLGEARRLLRPAGRILIFVPFENERRHRRFDPNEPNHHLFSWNPQTMGNLLTSAGFQIEEIGLGKYGWDRFVARWAERLRLNEGGYRFLRRTAVAINPLLEVVAVARST